MDIARNNQPPSKRSARVRPTRSLHIAIDLPWDASARMGTGVYAEVMIRALAAAAPDWRLSLLVSDDAPHPIELPNASYVAIPPVTTVHEGRRQIGLPKVLAKIRPDCLFSPASILPMIKVCPAVATIHDLTFRQRPEMYDQQLQRFLDFWISRSVHAADRLVVISKESSVALVEAFGVSADKMDVIEQPVRSAYTKRLPSSDVEAELTALGVARPFFFHVSNLSPHKNVPFAVAAFARYLETIPKHQNEPMTIHGCL